MHPVDEYAALKDQIKVLEARALALRVRFLASDAPLRSNQHEVVIRHLNRRVFQKDRLPPDVLNNSHYWDEVSNPSVVVKTMIQKEKSGMELILIEPF